MGGVSKSSVDYDACWPIENVISKRSVVRRDRLAAGRGGAIVVFVDLSGSTDGTIGAHDLAARASAECKSYCELCDWFIDGS